MSVGVVPKSVPKGGFLWVSGGRETIRNPYIAGAEAGI